MTFQKALAIEIHASQLASVAGWEEIADAWDVASKAWQEIGYERWALDCKHLAELIREEKIEFKLTLKPIPELPKGEQV